MKNAIIIDMKIITIGPTHNEAAIEINSKIRQHKTMINDENELKKKMLIEVVLNKTNRTIFNFSQS